MTPVDRIKADGLALVSLVSAKFFGADLQATLPQTLDEWLGVILKVVGIIAGIVAIWRHIASELRARRERAARSAGTPPPWMD